MRSQRRHESQPSRFWIEPRDPEISTLDPDAANEGKQGFQLIGHGEEHFKNPMPPTEKKLTGRIRAEDLGKPNAVFIYVDGRDSYAMLIESFSKEKQELAFQWKAISTPMPR